ncbi:hypothetical protein OCU04_012116 [Sclerotinia nivalis]|uniref:Uncharacterized protein n=1 Tax=Sclerotinia nivalis TaxID=352851 RepID=A0A9X0AAH7_9HELO|nr:hypothetical protein OCU04_012116 [Sclerotinia nivalis]
MSRIGGEDSAVPKVEEEDRVMSGVGEVDQDSITKARYSNVWYSRNMTTEQLLESLKKLTGPGAEDERKRRVMMHTQREKNLRQEAKDQARSAEKRANREFNLRREAAIQAEYEANPAKKEENRVKREKKKANKEMNRKREAEARAKRGEDYHQG